MANDNDLVEFIRSARGPIGLSFAAAELESLGNRQTGWPSATATHWQRELERLANKGVLNLCDGMLTVAKAESLKQGELF